jgi:hypothetical protein
VNSGEKGYLWVPVGCRNTAVESLNDHHAGNPVTQSAGGERSMQDLPIRGFCGRGKAFSAGNATAADGLFGDDISLTTITLFAA